MPLRGRLTPLLHDLGTKLHTTSYNITCPVQLIKCLVKINTPFPHCALTGFGLALSTSHPLPATVVLAATVRLIPTLKLQRIGLCLMNANPLREQIAQVSPGLGFILRRRLDNKKSAYE